MPYFKRLLVALRMNFSTTIIYIATGVAFLSIILLFIMLGSLALPLLLQTGANSPFTLQWSPANNQFGIVPMLLGSVLLSVLAIIIAVPLAITISCWLLAIGRGYKLAVVKNIIYFMTAIPTVVYGFIALFLLTPIIRQLFGGSGLCWLTASLMVSILILPTMILVICAGLQTRLNALCPSGLAIGFTKLDLLWTFILPNAKKTLLAATILGLGRAIGDTLLPLMLAGNATQITLHLSDSIRTLSAHMALVTANEVGGHAYNSLFIAGFLLLVINTLLSLLARGLTSKNMRQHFLGRPTVINDPKI